jgi:hypothetical protein
MRKISVRMHTQSLSIHRAVYRYLVRRRLMLIVTSALVVMHPIVHIHMHSALRYLGITDHPHEANAMSLRCPASEAMVLLQARVRMSVDSALGTVTVVDLRVPEGPGKTIPTSIAHVMNVSSSELVLFAEPRSGRSTRRVTPSEEYPVSMHNVLYFVCKRVQIRVRSCAYCISQRLGG